MSNGNKDIVTSGTQDILTICLEVLLAHKAEGRDLNKTIEYLERTIAKRQKEEAAT